MPRLAVPYFSGARPRQDRRLLAANEAAIAEECDLRSNALVPRKTTGASVAAGGNSIYLAKDGTWLTWATANVSVVEYPLSGSERIVYSGDGVPKVQESGTTYPLSVPAPTVAPTVAAQAKTASAFTSTFSWFYEELDGTRVDIDLMQVSFRNACFSWTVSGSGTNEYYVRTAAGANPHIDVKPTTVFESGSSISEGTLGSLALSEWAYGDNDSLGYDTLYVRTAGGTDPDTEATDYIVATVVRTLEETVFAEEFLLRLIPLKVSATANANLVIALTATDADGNNLGTVYPLTSLSAGASDFEYDGAVVSSSLAVTSCDATLTLTYDQTRVSGFETDRTYVYTYLRRWLGKDDESAPSPASTVLTVSPSEDVAISAIAAAPTGYGITHVRIYRSLTADSGTEFFFVDEIAEGVATYTDDATNTAVSLNEILPTTDWDEPPDDLAGIVLHPGNFLVGYGNTNTVYMSVPNQLHAFPAAYAFTTDYSITGIGIVGYTIVVLTTGLPKIFVGQTPDAVSPEKVYCRQACLSQQSVVQTKDFVGFASPDGYYGIRADGTEINFTEQLATRAQWQNQVVPSGVKADWYDNQLFIFTSRSAPTAPGVWILRMEPSGNDLTFSDEQADSVHVSLETDSLYFSKDSLIYQFEGGSTNKNAKWRSKTEVFDKPQSLSVVQIEAEDYPVTFRLFVAGVQVYEGTAVSNEAFKIPVLRRERMWSIEVESPYIVHAPITVAGSIQQMRDD